MGNKPQLVKLVGIIRQLNTHSEQREPIQANAGRMCKTRWDQNL